MIKPRDFVRLNAGKNKDGLFETHEQVADFTFDRTVVDVFPNMIERSVPDYWLMVDGIGQLAHQRIRPGATFYDLGCSLGAVAWSFYRHNQGANPIKALDCSEAMIQGMRHNLDTFEQRPAISILKEDIRTASLDNAGVVSLNLTLQFIHPDHRQALLERIQSHLMPGDVLFLTEKIRFECAELNRLIRRMHHQFKHEQGYSWLEIEKKADSIKQVMRVDTLPEHRARLAKVGFSSVSVWHQHYNFLSIMAIK